MQSQGLGLPMPPETKQNEDIRLQDRIAAKRYILAQMGLEWEPDDEDVKQEFLQLPKEGIVSFSAIPYTRPKEDFTPAAPIEKPVAADFTPFRPSEAPDDDFVELPQNPLKKRKTVKHSSTVIPPTEVTASEGGGQ